MLLSFLDPLDQLLCLYNVKLDVYLKHFWRSTIHGSLSLFVPSLLRHLWYFEAFLLLKHETYFELYLQLMKRRGYGAEYINRYKMMTRLVLFLPFLYLVILPFFVSVI